MPHPIRYLGQADVYRISHALLFLGIRFVVGIGLNVSAIHEYSVCIEVSDPCDFAENPVKNPADSFGGETVLEVVADGGEMGRFFLQPVAKKPTVIDISSDFFHCSAKRRQAI